MTADEVDELTQMFSNLIKGGLISSSDLVDARLVSTAGRVINRQEIGPLQSALARTARQQKRRRVWRAPPTATRRVVVRRRCESGDASPSVEETGSNGGSSGEAEPSDATATLALTVTAATENFQADRRVVVGDDNGLTAVHRKEDDDEQATEEEDEDFWKCRYAEMCHRLDSADSDTTSDS